MVRDLIFETHPRRPRKTARKFSDVDPKGPISREADEPAPVRALKAVPVSRAFRNAAFERFPILNDNPAYWILFCYLCFGSWHDEDTSRLLLCAETLSAIEGRDSANSRAEKFLIRFRDEVLRPVGGELRWTGSYIRKCRQLKKCGFGRDFNAILRREHRHDWDADGRVYLVDGSAFNRSNKRRLRRREREAAGQFPTLCDHAEHIRTYMNTLPANLFSKKLRERFGDAERCALDLHKSPVRAAQLRILRHINGQPQPFYSPSGEAKTVRLSTREAIPNLEGGVRRALTKGWVEADLRSSQFAICATLWAVPELLDFLRSDASLWTHLFDQMDVVYDLRKAVKRVLKKAIYAMCYGMDRVRLKNRCAYWLACHGLNKRLFQTLQQEPLIVALLNARDEALEKIAAAGGQENCYGMWRPVTKESQPKHIMADIAQAWEMKLIYPAFELAQRTRDFTITLFQHDGFSVHFTKQERLDDWKRKIATAVNQNADRYGFVTRLDWS